jgi:hypothetical protein
MGTTWGKSIPFQPSRRGPKPVVQVELQSKTHTLVLLSPKCVHEIEGEEWSVWGVCLADWKRNRLLRLAVGMYWEHPRRGGRVLGVACLPYTLTL